MKVQNAYPASKSSLNEECALYNVNLNLIVCITVEHGIDGFVLIDCIDFEILRREMNIIVGDTFHIMHALKQLRQKCNINDSGNLTNLLQSESITATAPKKRNRSPSPSKSLTPQHNAADTWIATPPNHSADPSPSLSPLRVTTNVVSPYTGHNSNSDPNSNSSLNLRDPTPALSSSLSPSLAFDSHRNYNEITNIQQPISESINKPKKRAKLFQVSDPTQWSGNIAQSQITHSSVDNLLETMGPIPHKVPAPTMKIQIAINILKDAFSTFERRVTVVSHNKMYTSRLYEKLRFSDKSPNKIPDKPSIAAIQSAQGPSSYWNKEILKSTDSLWFYRPIRMRLNPMVKQTKKQKKRRLPHSTRLKMVAIQARICWIMQCSDTWIYNGLCTGSIIGPPQVEESKIPTLEDILEKYTQPHISDGSKILPVRIIY